VDDPHVVEAFGRVPRERFLGPGPWLIRGHEDYVSSQGTDPAALYDDIVVALDADKRINNGQPSLHARCLSAARVKTGERALHVGCGSGYYSAIIAELVGASGVVHAWDVEPALAASARSNLEAWPQAHAALRDATASPIPRSDFIYVSAGCTHPVRAWAEALGEGGRLVMPLTPGWDFGGMLMLTRRGDRYDARFLCRCAFIPSVGASNEEERESVRDAFERGGMHDVRELRFDDAPRGSGWLAGDGWRLLT